MPGPRAVQNLQMSHPRDWQGVQMPLSSPGGAWAQVELTDALALTSTKLQVTLSTHVTGFYERDLLNFFFDSI